VHDDSFIRFSELGSIGVQEAGHSFGKKLTAIAQLTKKLPAEDQAIVFAPNEETIETLEAVFGHNNITYHSPSRSTRAGPAKIMEEFKKNNDPKKRKRLIILSLGSESAAGV
jgi:superfamily II DNA or RNA helicase